MDKQQLIEQFEAGTINRQSKGVLRRIVIKEIFEDLIEQPLEIIAKILNEKRTKVDLKELAKLVGYEIKDTNIRQSFMNEVRPFQDKLREKGHIKVVEKNRTQEKDDNAKALIDFLHTRLAEPDYKWPMHLRGNLYRRAIWAYFIDTPLDEVKYPGAPMSQKEVIELVEKNATHFYIRNMSSQNFIMQCGLKKDWKKVEIRFIPTAVDYPEHGISHFRAFEDNVLISWMHTRLFFGMLIRSPQLILRKFR